MEGEAIFSAQSFLPPFQREGRFGELALPLPRWQPAAGSGRGKFSLSAAGCPAPPVSPAMPAGPLERRECESPAMPTVLATLTWLLWCWHPGLQPGARGANPAAPASSASLPLPASAASLACLNHTMAPDIYGAATPGTQHGGDFRLSGLARQWQP